MEVEMDSCGNSLDIEEIRVFVVDSVKHAFVVFSNESDCLRIHEFYNQPDRYEKEICFNSFGDLMEFNYCYDAKEIKNSKWFGVVVRNLVTFNDLESVFQTNLPDLRDKLYYYLEPKYVLGSLCTIVVFEDLDNAEKFCCFINESGYTDKFEGNKLKVI